MRAAGYVHAGGRHAESVAVRNLLAHAGAVAPHTAAPFGEALCFGLAGGIGAGYSFCPSVPRYGPCSGVSIVGRHKSYATDAAWFTGAFDRLGVTTRITETGGPGKAAQNLAAELHAGRPAVVWVSRARLPFLGNPMESNDLWMHSFVVSEIDEKAGLARGSDRSAQPVTIALDDLAAARNGVCSHKNRTLTIAPPGPIPLARLREAIAAAIRATSVELLDGRMKTFSLPGLELWAKMIANGTAKDGWLKVFGNGLIFEALRDAFDSIETCGNGGGLYRPLYAEFLAEAAPVLNKAELAEVGQEYARLGADWTKLADALLPDRVPAFKKAKAALRKRSRLIDQKGQAADALIAKETATLQAIRVEMRKQFPLVGETTAKHLGELRERILALHAREVSAAQRLAAAL